MGILAHLEKATTFQRIMDHGSLRQASKNLGVSQPALSRTLAILETECDGSLATRTASGLRPTSLGLDLLELAQHVERLACAFESRRAQRHAREKLRVGTYESIAVYLFPQILTPDDGSGPAIALGTDSSARLVERLVAGEFDCIVSVNPPDRSVLVTHPLFEDTYALYATRAVAAALRRPRTGPVRGAYVPDARDAHGTSIATHLSRAGVDTDSWIACQTFETAKALALAGMPAVLPSRVALGTRARSALVPVQANGLRAPFGAHDIGFSHLRRRSGDVAVQRVHAYIERALRAAATPRNRAHA